MPICPGRLVFRNAVALPGPELNIQEAMALSTEDEAHAVLMYSDTFTCGGDQLILIKSSELSNTQPPVAHHQEELGVILIEVAQDKFTALLESEIFL